MRMAAILVFMTKQLRPNRVSHGYLKFLSSSSNNSKAEQKVKYLIIYRAHLVMSIFSFSTCFRTFDAVWETSCS